MAKCSIIYNYLQFFKAVKCVFPAKIGFKLIAKGSLSLSNITQKPVISGELNLKEMFYKDYDLYLKDVLFDIKIP